MNDGLSTVRRDANTTEGTPGARISRTDQESPQASWKPGRNQGQLVALTGRVKQKYPMKEDRRLPAVYCWPQGGSVLGCKSGVEKKEIASSCSELWRWKIPGIKPGTSPVSASFIAYEVS